MESHDILNLETNYSLQLSYLAEGAANVVYRVTPLQLISTNAGNAHSAVADALLSTGTDISQYSSTTPPPTKIEISPESDERDPLDGFLVRFRKKLPAGTARSVANAHADFRRLISPLFPADQLVEQKLFRAKRETLIRCNEELSSLDAAKLRPPKRRGTFLDEEQEYGLLITDMTGKGDETVVELKPKWLTQSPSAPSGSKRCRTCALAAMRRQSITSPKFCPLKLISLDKRHVQEVVDHVTSKSQASRNVLSERLSHNLLLKRLYDMQQDFDPIGILRNKNPVGDERLALAMTLRDCLLFVRMTRDGEKVEMKLADLDLKPASEEKTRYWRSIEEDLIRGGWYTATGGGASAGNEICLLFSGKS